MYVHVHIIDILLWVKKKMYTVVQLREKSNSQVRQYRRIRLLHHATIAGVCVCVCLVYK